jgi:hypothetical protein
VPAAQRQIANLYAVPRAAARAGAVAQGLTKALQRGTSDRVVAIAEDLAAGLGFLKPQLAAGHHAHVRRGDRRSGRRSGSCGKRRPRETFGQYSAGHAALLS